MRRNTDTPAPALLAAILVIPLPLALVAGCAGREKSPEGQEVGESGTSQPAWPGWLAPASC